MWRVSTWLHSGLGCTPADPQKIGHLNVSCSAAQWRGTAHNCMRRGHGCRSSARVPGSHAMHLIACGYHWVPFPLEATASPCRQVIAGWTDALRMTEFRRHSVLHVRSQWICEHLMAVDRDACGSAAACCGLVIVDGGAQIALRARYDPLLSRRGHGH